MDEMHVVVGGIVEWLWQAIDEHGEVLDVLLQAHRDTGAAKRFFRRLMDDQEIPERIVTDGLRSYGAAIAEVPELGAAEHVTVSAAERQNNLIEQSHRPTRDQERQQRGFRGIRHTQRFLFAHAEVGNLFRYTRARTPARLRHRNFERVYADLAMLIAQHDGVYLVDSKPLPICKGVRYSRERNLTEAATHSFTKRT